VRTAHPQHRFVSGVHVMPKKTTTRDRIVHVPGGELQEVQSARTALCVAQEEYEQCCRRVGVRRQCRRLICSVHRKLCASCAGTRCVQSIVEFRANALCANATDRICEMDYAVREPCQTLLLIALHHMLDFARDSDIKNASPAPCINAENRMCFTDIHAMPRGGSVDTSLSVDHSSRHTLVGALKRWYAAHSAAMCDANNVGNDDDTRVSSALWRSAARKAASDGDATLFVALQRRLHDHFTQTWP